MGKYPPYACSCCGYTNGDMFYDHFKYKGVEPTPKEVAFFDGYREAWRMLSDEREKAKAITSLRVWPKTRIGKQHSEATRAKISATKKRNAKLKPSKSKEK